MTSRKSEFAILYNKGSEHESFFHEDSKTGFPRMGAQARDAARFATEAEAFRVRTQMPAVASIMSDIVRIAPKIERPVPLKGDRVWVLDGQWVEGMVIETKAVAGSVLVETDPATRPGHVGHFAPEHWLWPKWHTPTLLEVIRDDDALSDRQRSNADVVLKALEPEIYYARFEDIFDRLSSGCAWAAGIDTQSVRGLCKRTAVAFGNYARSRYLERTAK